MISIGKEVNFEPKTKDQYPKTNYVMISMGNISIGNLAMSSKGNPYGQLAKAAIPNQRQSLNLLNLPI